MFIKLLTLLNLKKIYFNYKYGKIYAAHNLVYFRKKKKIHTKKIILVELNNLRDCHILYSYVVNILSEKFQAQIYAYQPRYFRSYINFLIFKIKLILKTDYFKIYMSFNVVKFFFPNKKINKSKYFDLILEKILKKIKNNSDIYNISILNINIGDLIYDSYLRKYNLPTINSKDLNSKKFRYFLSEFIMLFFYWKNFFKTNDVKGLFVSHGVYEFGIIARIAINLKIPTYIGDMTRLHKLDKNHLNHFDMNQYKKEFKLFSPVQKKKNLLIAKKFLKKRFSGQPTIENVVSNLPTVKLFGNPQFGAKVIRNSKNYKCLIAAHHFSDAPNAFGRILFNDFYEWIDFLGKLSIELNYDWYIKLHPDEYNANKNIVNFFLKKYPKFTLIKSTISHEQLISEGIDLVLTVYGTIGLEYAYFKIPVINASLNNPHISYNFNYHPKNINEYRNAIINFKSLNLNFDKRQIYEYYFMRYLCTFYLFPTQLINPEPLTQGYEAYQKWLKLFNKDLHIDINSKIKKFIDSEKFRMIVNNEIKL
jgi:hypothetical protein